MNAWRWLRGTRIEALGDPVGEAPVGNVPLAEQQVSLVERAGFRVRETDAPASIEDDEFLLLYDNLFASWPLLARFLKQARQRAAEQPGVYQLALEQSPYSRLASFTGEQREVELDDGRKCLCYGLFWIRRGRGVELSLDNARPIAIDQWRKEVTIPFSSRISTMSDVQIPFTDVVAIELTSWVHLWLANLYAVAVSLMERVRRARHWPWLALKTLTGALSAWSLSPYRIAASAAGKLVVRGRGCRVHPTAVVEVSILGDGVEIGPHSVVRGSILGDGVNVMEQSSVDLSVLGNRVIIHSHGMVKLTLAYPEAVFNWCQAGVVGRRVYLGSMFRPLDLKFRGEVRVVHRGELVSTGLPFFGCCIGHRALVSGSSRLAPGRVIPNDYRILTDMGAIESVPELPTDEFLDDRRGKLESRRKPDQ